MHEREQRRRVIVKGIRRWFTVARSSSQACREEGMRETELVVNASINFQSQLETLLY